MSSRQKNCTHCGETTHPQPQDPNHDTGYGHCYSCLNKKEWYVRSEHRPHLLLSLVIWEARGTNNGSLTLDDSHAKVVELIFNDKVENHFTTYTTIKKIKEWAAAKVKNLETEKRLLDLFKHI